MTKFDQNAILARIAKAEQLKTREAFRRALKKAPQQQERRDQKDKGFFTNRLKLVVK